MNATETPHQPLHVLVVEDEYVTAADIRNRITAMGHAVVGISDTGEEAIRMSGEQAPGLVLMDITLKGAMTGIEAAAEIRGRWNIPVIFLTAHADDATVEAAAASEPYGYLVKPLDDVALKTAIRMAVYKHRMEEELRSRERIIRGLLDATSDETVMVDRDGKILAWNSSFARSAGVPPEGLKDRIVYELIATGGISMQLAEAIRAGREAPESFEEESGGRWLDTTIYPIGPSTDGTARWAVFRHDITPLRQAGERLAAANARLVTEKERLVLFAAALDDMGDCVVITDSFGKIVCVNATLERRFRIPRADLKGHHISELAHPENKYPITAEDFFHHHDTDNTAAFVARNAYGLRMPMTLKSRPFFPENNRPRFFVFVLRDQQV